jgi:hypothetical protein
LFQQTTLFIFYETLFSSFTKRSYILYNLVAAPSPAPAPALSPAPGTQLFPSFSKMFIYISASHDFSAPTPSPAPTLTINHVDDLPAAHSPAVGESSFRKKIVKPQAFHEEPTTFFFLSAPDENPHLAGTSIFIISQSEAFCASFQ